MKSKDLLSKLSVLESLLHDFSYEELSSKEASYLKKSFESFKTDLESLVYGDFESLSVQEDQQVGSIENGESGKLIPELTHSKRTAKTKDLANEDAISGMQVLIFEDNHLSQRLIDLQLTQYKCKTFVTDNPQVGLKILEDNQIDMILMDLRMPLMSGFEVTALIRKSKNKRTASIPIIAVSADISLRDEEKCRTSGINDFILKPYSLEELSFKLAKHSNRDQNSRPISNAPKSTTSSSNKGLDITVLLEECDGDMELLQDLALLFKQNSLEFIDSAKKAIANSDRKALKFASHKIKNGLAMLRATELREVALEIYKGCEAKMPWEGLKSLCHQYTEKYPKVEKELDGQLNKLRYR